MNLAATRGKPEILGRETARGAQAAPPMESVRVTVDGLRAVIFDCDGVLVDSRDAHRVYFNRLRAGVGLGPITTEQEDYTFMCSSEEALRYLVPEELLEQAIRVREQIGMKEIVPLMRLQPGVCELVAALRRWGLATAINTNSDGKYREVLDSLGLTRFFDVIITESEVDRPKPDPQGARKILEQLGIAAEEAAFLGDSPVDEQAARAAGLTFWAYRNPKLQADYHIQDYRAFLTSLEKLGARNL